MAEAVVFGLAEEVLKNMGSAAVGEIASAWGFKERLEQLKESLSTVKDVLLDAEEKQAHSLAVRNWLQSLADVVYDADDLFDEFATVAARKQLMGGNQVNQEVCDFFSNSNQIAFSFEISRKIKRTKEELDDVVKKGNDFGLVRRCYEEGRVVSRRGDDTYSFVKSEEIIGRDDDKQVILNMLLASGSTDDDEHEDEVLHVIPIVGMGGMGKTALAQLIYNDPRVQEFFDLRLWVCVSEDFDIKEITAKILRSATDAETPELDLEQLQGRLRNEIPGKKYLLVLDDVWNENCDEWQKLRDLLKVGRKGSKIIVTTRSRKAAKIMGTIPYAHELGGLSEEKSWALFEKVAFEPGQAQQKPHLVNIGKEMIKKCAGVPLAIRTLGRLLYAEDESKWMSFMDTSLANISDDDRSGIVDILRLSYHHLGSPLKSCFAYCALFPKDYKFSKETLIDLWMAEGFIFQASKESWSLEELGEDYFHTLLQRGFLQDVEMDDNGAIKSCKMHDLMHDLAQEVAGVKCKVVNPNESQYDSKIRHLSFAYCLTFQKNIPDEVLKLQYLRTFLLPQQVHDGSTFNKLICQKLISSLSCLRVLDLQHLGVKILPSSIGKLVHLRYLNLSDNPLIELPNSITELQNLQTLNLFSCKRLKRLPRNIRKLINLRSLNLRLCRELQEMPSGLGELTLLHKLPVFIVNSHHNAKLSDLNKLNNLRGELRIKINKGLKNTKLEATEANMINKHGLIDVRIEFDGLEDERDDEIVLESLKPHSNLRKLAIDSYCSHELPTWMNSLCTTLPKLVEIILCDWNNCQKLPSFSQLPLLKKLTLWWLSTVEYMEMENNVCMPTPLFFPSLEYLELRAMENLKEISSMSFPKLSELHIMECPNLTSMPNCPNLKYVHLDNNKKLSMEKMITTTSKLKELWIHNVKDLISFPKQNFCQISVLTVSDTNLVCTGKLGQVFASLSSSLRSLEFWYCDSLRSISKGLEHLTALEELSFFHCPELQLSEVEEEDEDEDGMPWKAFKNLRSLKISYNKNLKGLPEWISCLPTLRSLVLSYCEELSSLPQGIRKLTTLNQLLINNCPKLRDSYQLLINQHIPSLYLNFE